MTSEHGSAPASGATQASDGEDTQVYVVAVAAVVMREGRVLAMRRSGAKQAGPGLWETLSGRLQPGEEPYDAVRREIAEECGVEVEVDRRPVTAYVARRLGLPMVVVVYRARHVSGAVRPSEEHDAFEWLTPAEFARRSSLVLLVGAVELAFELPP